MTEIYLGAKPDEQQQQQQRSHGKQFNYELDVAWKGDGAQAQQAAASPAQKLSSLLPRRTTERC